MMVPQTERRPSLGIALNQAARLSRTLEVLGGAGWTQFLMANGSIVSYRPDADPGSAQFVGDETDAGVPERPAHFEGFDEAGPEVEPDDPCPICGGEHDRIDRRDWDGCGGDCGPCAVLAAEPGYRAAVDGQIAAEAAP